MNSQYSGTTAWHDYLSALEQATPVIEAIAVTDYYVTDTYVEVLKQKAAGRLPAAKLIFPNVELRLDVATAKGGFVNLGACQGSCRLCHAAKGCLSAATCVATTESRSGLRVTAPIGIQLRVRPDHLAGVSSRAWV